MTELRAALTDYLELRRSLGFTLRRDAKLLIQFLDWLEGQDKHTITVADALVWVRLPENASPSWLRARMGPLRGFATYLHTLDPAVEVPAPGLFGGPPARAVPYLYSDTEIIMLIEQTASLSTALRRATIATLIGLLAVTGMRQGEVIALDDIDFDATRGLLVVRRGKAGKSRQIPLHPTTTAALKSYRTVRDRAFPKPVSEALLVSAAGTRLLSCNVGHAFRRMVRQAGLTARSPRCRPRPHDLRHTFAVATLLDWYRDGGDVAARLPLLSTYLGHVSPEHTYWYLHAAPELMAEAAGRLERYAAQGGRS
jgi:integrase/recombinase XerD